METSKIPPELRYTKTHEWVRVDGSTATIGITDHAQAELTDIVFVELPAVGKAVQHGASALVLESVKTVADIYAPGDGTIAAVNTDLKSHPELVNQEPYGRGWLVQIALASPIDLTALLSADDYRRQLEGGA